MGDQLFTDVYGANRAGLYSVLVKPMNPREEIQIVLKRYLEKPVLWSYERHAQRHKPETERLEAMDGKTRVCGADWKSGGAFHVAA